ncbi:MAG: hypothetical protein IKV46_04525 [Bacteroidales bacterium]|nr:hypothetical protein [Bacteroidales bacterium]
MKKSSKTYTVIDWEELRNIKFYGDYYVETNPMKEKIHRNLTSTDLFIIFYIKGFGEKGYYGSQRSIAELLGITPEQVNRSMKMLLKVVNISNDEPLFIKDEEAIYYNPKFLYRKDGKKLDCSDFISDKYKRKKKNENIDY